MELAGNGYVPPPVDAANIANPIGDAVMEFFKPVAATEFDVFVCRGPPSEVDNEIVNVAAGLKHMC